VNREILSTELLAEIEDLLVSMPALGNVISGDPATMPWLGRVDAVFSMLGPLEASRFRTIQDDLLSHTQWRWTPAIPKLVALLHSARHRLTLSTQGPRSVAIAVGGVFDYFEEVRKVLITAKSDLLIVDPYADASFVSRFLTQVDQGVYLRVLSKD
jgi:hypothetical protein